MKNVKRIAFEIISKKVKGFTSNIEKDTLDNNNFRKVLYTGKNSQLVLMSLKAKEDIGEEIHKDNDQFFRIESGKGKVVIDGTETVITDGSAIVIPAGAKHNVINTGDKELKLYSIYSPPHHEDKTIHKTKEDATKSKEHFDGKTTEKVASNKKIVELAVVSTDKLKTEKYLKEEHYRYTLGRSDKPGAILFKIEINDFGDYKMISSDLEDKSIQFEHE
jgi:mannose-6-phosphate isomerase-like protein (cupin superfamily)